MHNTLRYGAGLFCSLWLASLLVGCTIVQAPGSSGAGTGGAGPSGAGPSGAGPGSSVPPGKVPADLVGRWEDSDTIIDFGADGSVNYFIKWTNCSTLDSGVAVVTDADMTLHFTTGTYGCAWAFEPKTRTFTYYLASGGTAIHMIETNCGTSCWANANLDKQ